MKRIILSALALLGVGIMANAQEKVKVHNGAESYVTTIEYVTFDATDADEVVSVSDLQSANATLATDKSNLEAQVSTLTSEKAALESKVKTMEYVLVERAKVHEYVDLGLTSGTLWATMNVGASSPEEYGGYFAWGEIVPQSSNAYSWSSYKLCNGSANNMTKYSNSSDYGVVDNKTELDDEDDVAVQAWGGAWSVPTYEQQTELRNNCYWVWTTSYNGKSVSGYIVYKAKSVADKGKKVYSGSTPSSSYNVSTDAHIFLPATGYRKNDDIRNEGTYGCYWAHTLGDKRADFARSLSFNASSVSGYDDNRCFGRSVRPVCPAIE